MERKGTITRKVTRSPDESTDEHKHTETWAISAITDAFLDQKRVNVCEHVVKWAILPHVHIHLLSSDSESHLWSHTFTFFWLREASVIAEISQVSACLCFSLPVLSSDQPSTTYLAFGKYLKRSGNTIRTYVSYL